MTRVLVDGKPPREAEIFDTIELLGHDSNYKVLYDLAVYDDGSLVLLLQYRFPVKRNGPTHFESAHNKFPALLSSCGAR